MLKHKNYLTRFLQLTATTFALWYSGTNNYLDKSADLRTAIKYFEKVLPLLKEIQGQYYSANWFIGRCICSAKNQPGRLTMALFTLQK